MDETLEERIADLESLVEDACIANYDAGYAECRSINQSFKEKLKRVGCIEKRINELFVDIKRRVDKLNEI